MEAARVRLNSRREFFHARMLVQNENGFFRTRQVVLSIAVRIGSFLLAVCGDSVRFATSTRFEVFRDCGRIRASVADAVRGPRIEDDSVDLRAFPGKTAPVWFAAGDCESGAAGIAGAEMVGEGSVLTTDVV